MKNQITVTVFTYDLSRSVVFLGLQSLLFHFKPIVGCPERDHALEKTFEDFPLLEVEGLAHGLLVFRLFALPFSFALSLAFSFFRSHR
jgi:hypothetical protein